MMGLLGRDRLCLLHLAGVMSITTTRGWTGACQEHQNQTGLEYHDLHSMSKVLTHCLIFLACYNLLITAFGVPQACVSSHDTQHQ